MCAHRMYHHAWRQPARPHTYAHALPPAVCSDLPYLPAPQGEAVLNLGWLQPWQQPRMHPALMRGRALACPPHLQLAVAHSGRRPAFSGH